MISTPFSITFKLMMASPYFCCLERALDGLNIFPTLSSEFKVNWCDKCTHLEILHNEKICVITMRQVIYKD